MCCRAPARRRRRRTARRPAPPRPGSTARLQEGVEVGGWGLVRRGAAGDFQWVGGRAGGWDRARLTRGVARVGDDDHLGGCWARRLPSPCPRQLRLQPVEVGVERVGGAGAKDDVGAAAAHLQRHEVVEVVGPEERGVWGAWGVVGCGGGGGAVGGGGAGRGGGAGGMQGEGVGAQGDPRLPVPLHCRTRGSLPTRSRCRPSLEQHRAVSGVEQGEHDVCEGLVGAGGDHDVVLQARSGRRQLDGSWCLVNE